MPAQRPVTPLSLLVNAPDTFEVAGRTYKVGELDVLQIARYEKWLEDRAISLTAKLSENMPEATRNEVINQIAQGIAAGTYSWGGSACLKSFQEREGLAYLIYLAVQQHDDPTFQVDDAKRVADELIKERVEKIIALRLAPDPKG